MTEYPDKSVGQIGIYSGNLGLGHIALSTRTEAIARGAFRDLAEKHRKATGQRVWLRCYHNFTDESDLG